MTRILLLLILALCIISCKGQEYEDEQFDLSKLNFNLNADKFYSKSMNREISNFQAKSNTSKRIQLMNMI